MIRIFALPCITLALAACATEPAPTPWTNTVVLGFNAPDECKDKNDPKAILPPDADVPSKDTARIAKANYQVIRDLKGLRHVCGVAVEKYQTQQATKDAKKNG